MKKKEKIEAAVLGATGLIGQVFVSMLSDHPLFEPASLAGSGRGGERYREKVHWRLPFPIPESAGTVRLSALSVDSMKEAGVKYVFSALPSGAAGEIENYLRDEGFFVFSNAGAHRYDDDVPILIPDVNPGSLRLIREQGFPSRGFIVANPNCSTAGLAVALQPLKRFGIEEVTVSTYQAVSGAGYPGLSAMDIHGEVIPFIEGEEKKMGTETRKILDIDFPVMATCVRVPTLFGHLESVWVRFRESPSTDDILNAWEGTSTDGSLHSLHGRMVEYTGERGPGSHLAFRGTPPGMQVFTGGLRQRSGKTGFNLLVNNLVRGGAGGSVANAELFHRIYGAGQ